MVLFNSNFTFVIYLFAILLFLSILLFLLFVFTISIHVIFVIFSFISSEVVNVSTFVDMFSATVGCCPIL